MLALVLQLGSYVLWFPLKILCITALLRTGVRRYPLIFAYMVVTFVFALAQVPGAWAYRRKDFAAGHWFQVLHAIDEVFTYTLILSVVISLVFRATADIRSRRTV